MAEKLRNPDFPSSLTEGGWFIPTDYVLMKPSFRKQVMRLYVEPMQTGSRVLDLNAGTEGLGEQIVAAGFEYEALEQNRLIRDVLSSQQLKVRDWRPPRIPHADGTFDLILAFAFLEHLPTWIAAMEQLLDIKRTLVPGGRFVVVAPNAPGTGATFWEDYKQNWPVSRKRLVDMAADAGFEVLSTRYSVGWVTLRGGFLGAALRFAARSANASLNVSFVSRLLESIKLDTFAAKVRKTIFELVAVEMEKPDGS